MRNKLHTVFYVIPAILVFVGVAISRNALENPLNTRPAVFGDLLIVAAFIILLWSALRRSIIIGRPAHKRLESLGSTVLVFVLFLFVSSMLIEAGTDASGDIIPEALFSGNIFFISGLIFLSCLIAGTAFVRLFSLILVRQRGKTKQQLTIFVISFIAYLVASSFAGKNFLADGFMLAESGLIEVSAQITGFITIFLMVLSSFRNSWVNYLNKKQKVYSFLSGAALLVSIIIIEQSTNSVFVLYLKGFSVSASLLFNLTTYFIVIYFLLGVFSILLHLPTAGIFDKKVQQLTSLFQVGSVLTNTLKFDKLMQFTTKQALDVVNADAAWIMMKRKSSDSLKLAASSNVPVTLLNIIRHKEFAKIAERIIESREVLMVESHNQCKELPLDRNIRKAGFSLIGVPLISPGRGVLGILFTYKAQEYAFDKEDSEMIRAFANQTTIAIDNSLLFEESLEKERMQQELNVARDIQLKLLPKEIPFIADHIKIEAVSIPAYEVGGDYYDFIRLTDSKLGIYVGDVSGKSISAALYMAEIKGFIQSLARLYHSPAELLKKVNETLYTNIDRKSFISMLVAVIDFEQNTVTFTRAGHTPLGYFDPESGEWSFIQPEGLGLGLDKGTVFNSLVEEKTIAFQPGAAVFIYTDGVTEVFNREGELFGEDRLLTLLEKCKNNGVDNYCSAILEEINVFSHSAKPDDMTMVVIRHELPGKESV